MLWVGLAAERIYGYECQRDRNACQYNDNRGAEPHIKKTVTAIQFLHCSFECDIIDPTILISSSRVARLTLSGVMTIE